MSLVDLKYTPKEAKEEKAEMMKGPDVPIYPWGLKLRLEKEEIDKLGITTLPKVGDEYHILAMGRVVSVAQSYRDSDESTCVEIQLVMMQMENEGADDDEDTPADEKKEMDQPASTESLKSMMSFYQSKKS